MTNLVLLKQVIVDSGIPYSFIAERLGITRPTLYSKLDGKSDFTITQASALSEVLHLSDTLRDIIFFSENVNKIDTFVFGTNEENQVSVSTAQSMTSLGGYVNATGEWVSFRSVIYPIIPDEEAMHRLDEIREV